MSKHVALIFALLLTSAAADDYRSFKEAYAGVPWPKTMTSIEQCQKQVADTVRQFGFTDAELKPSRWTRDTDLWVKDKKNHFDIETSCPFCPPKRTCAVQLGMSA